MRPVHGVGPPKTTSDLRDWDAAYLHAAGARSVHPPLVQHQPVLKQRPRSIPQQVRKPVAHSPPASDANSIVSRQDARPPAHSAQTAAPTLAARLESAGKREFRRGLVVVGLALGLAGSWAAFVPLSGAVVASGNVVTASDAKKIQHLTGGVVREILVHDGARVDAGDVLVRLDPTNARGALAIAAKQLMETRALIQRLTSERDGKSLSQTGLPLLEGVSQADTNAAIVDQLTLSEARNLGRKQMIAIELTHIKELQHTAEAAQAQLAAKQDERDMAATELASIEDLYRQKLTTLSRLMGLRREKAELDGAIGSLQATILEAQSKIAEAKLELAKGLEDVKVKVLTDLREAQAKENELVERQKMAREQLQEIAIRAPQSGTVHDMSVHTIGGVVGPGEVLMMLAPDRDDLQIEAQLQPKDIAQVTPGQPAMLRFAAFDRNATPELLGSVTYVSPDITHDPRTNAATYTTRITIGPDEVRRLGNFHLLAGMPAEVYLITQSRTALSYLFKPLLDQLHRTFRGR